MSPILESIGSVKGFGWGALPAGGSFESIQTITVGTTSQASVTFSSIPATYTHLQLRISNRGGGSTVQLNSDTTSNYKRHYLYTDGTSVLAGTGGAADGMSLLSYSTTANVLAANILDILDYTNTNKYKTLRNLSGVDSNGSGEVFYASGLWLSTSAITSITITGATITQYSSFALYGIKGAA